MIRQCTFSLNLDSANNKRFEFVLSKDFTLNKMSLTDFAVFEDNKIVEFEGLEDVLNAEGLTAMEAGALSAFVKLFEGIAKGVKYCNKLDVKKEEIN